MHSYGAHTDKQAHTIHIDKDGVYKANRTYLSVVFSGKTNKQIHSPNMKVWKDTL